MAYDLTPTVGDWYEDSRSNAFEIVAFDSVHGLIEIQFFDGTVEELDIESWYGQMLNSIEPPEDWSGSLDIEKQDYGVDFDENTHYSKNDPLDTFDL